MPIAHIPTHRFFWNGSDEGRYRDAQAVAELCARLGLSEDEAIDLLAAVGRIELARQNASVGGVPCRRMLELARLWNVSLDGEG